jgi:hypothetical protein
MPPPSTNLQQSQLVSHQPPINPQLTPEELEQLKGVQKWAEIRKERRKAAGLPEEGTVVINCLDGGW